MKKLNNNTQRAKGFIWMYNRARQNGHTSELSSIYKSYSKAKEDALHRCKWLQQRFDGHNGIVVCGNSMAFTYGFEYVDKEDGTVKLAYITKDNDYTMDYLY